MVGYDPYSQFELSTLDYSLAGTFSGVTCRACCQPFDVLKIRFQLQIDPIRRNQGKYFGLWQATQLIVKEEGVKALWKGHMPAQALSIIFGMVQFGSFEWLTKNSFSYLPPSLSGWIGNFGAGAVSGCLATVAALPCDVLRTRLIAQGCPKIYNGMFDASVNMFRHEGVLSFYRGLQFAFYRMSTNVWASVLSVSSSDVGPLESLVCGSVAGTAAKVAVYPLDMLKKRLQVQHVRLEILLRNVN